MYSFVLIVNSITCISDNEEATRECKLVGNVWNRSVREFSIKTE